MLYDIHLLFITIHQFNIEIHCVCVCECVYLFDINTIIIIALLYCL